MPPRRQSYQARCTRCGHVGPLRAFEVEIALCADDSGDSDWVINYSCPACEAAERPAILEAGVSPAGRAGVAVGAIVEPTQVPLGVRPNAIYDPAAP